MLKNKYLISFAIIVVFAVIIYLPSIKYNFIEWDDHTYIKNNTVLQNGNFKDIYFFDKFISLTLYSYTKPDISYQDYLVIHRSINIILHIINTLLVFALLSKFSRNRVLIIIFGLLFFVHPMKVESVAWMMQRKDLLYTLFYLLATIAYLHYLTKKRVWIMLLIFGLGMLSSISKIQSLTLPLLLLTTDFIYKRKDYLLLFTEKIVLAYLMISFIYNNPLHHWFIGLFLIIYLFHTEYFKSYWKPRTHFMKILWNRNGKILLALIVLIGITYLFIKYEFYNYNIASMWRTIPSPEIPAYSFVDRLFLASYSLMYYILSFVFPFRLNPIELLPNVKDCIFPIYYYISALILIIALIVFFLTKRHKKMSKQHWFGLFYFLTAISMVVHIIDIESHTIVTSRYTYNAYVGLTILAACLIDNYFLKSRKTTQRNIIILLTILGAVFTVISTQYIKTWKNSYTFWSYTLKKNPNNHLALFGLGNYFADTKPELALEYYSKAINKKKDIPYLHLGRARLYNKLENLNQAKKDVNKILQINNTNPDALYLRASISYNQDLYFDAIADLNMLLSLNKNHIEGMLLKSLILIKLGQTDEAKEIINNIPTEHRTDIYYDIANQINNNKEDTSNTYYFQLINSAFEAAKNNNFNASIEYLNKAILLLPDKYNAYQNRGNIYIEIEEYELALQDYNTAISLNPDESSLYLNKGYLMFLMQNMEQACIIWQIATDKGNLTAFEMLDNYCK